jgi:hypothetical protein
MYIVNRGKLHVMADNNKTVLATLKAGRENKKIYLKIFIFIRFIFW